MISEAIVVALIMVGVPILATACAWSVREWRRWRREAKAAQADATQQAEERGYQKARAEAIAEKAQDAIAAKDTELATVHAALAAKDAQLTRCETRNDDLRALLMACRGGSS